MDCSGGETKRMDGRSPTIMMNDRVGFPAGIKLARWSSLARVFKEMIAWLGQWGWALPNQRKATPRQNRLKRMKRSDVYPWGLQLVFLEMVLRPDSWTGFTEEVHQGSLRKCTIKKRRTERQSEMCYENVAEKSVGCMLESLYVKYIKSVVDQSKPIHI